jgi:hypothetical protein
LVGEILLEVRDVGPPELAVDPVIAGGAGNEGIHDRRDRIGTAEPLVQRCHLRPLIAWWAMMLMLRCWDVGVDRHSVHVDRRELGRLS